MFPVVLYADNHLLVVHKPIGMPVQPDNTGARSVYDWAKDWIRNEKGKADGNVFCGIVHRLDRNVSGVLVFARTSKAASRLSRQWQKRTVLKDYAALASPCPDWSGEKTLTHHLEREDRTRRTTVHKSPGPRTKEAITRVCVLENQGDVGVVELFPETGRPHQLRAQMAYEGYPLVGDRKYGSRASFEGLCLHARSLNFEHPTRGERLCVTSPVPQEWSRAAELPAKWVEAGGVEWSEAS